jgi:hypothetical protein
MLLALSIVPSALLAAHADGPPGPPPYSPITLESAGGDYGDFSCTRAGRVVWHGQAWTLEPLVRGPNFAPVVLWLEGTNAPVLPVSFSNPSVYEFGYWWYTQDDGPEADGTTPGVTNARPVGYGSVPTTAEDLVECGIYFFGGVDLGVYRITRSLQRLMPWDGERGIPVSMVGRSLDFEGDDFSLYFSVPASQFPTTATTKAVTLATPTRSKYHLTALPSVTCRDAKNLAYQGAAWTMAPLVRGYQWSPMALWLDGDRIVAPRWFSSKTTGTWKTTSGTPALQGALDAEQRARPSGFGVRPAKATSGVHCTWSGPHSATRVATKALVKQLGLPSNVRGRTVELTGYATVHAYTPTWMWPPRG